jgi:hypothetical protein
MSSGAKRAIGTKLKLGNGGSPESFAAVPEITSLSLGGTKVDIIDTTNMDSPADAVTGLIFREKLGGLADGGEVSFSMNFLPTSTAQIAFRAARMACCITSRSCCRPALAAGHSPSPASSADSTTISPSTSSSPLPARSPSPAPPRSPRTRLGFLTHGKAARY